VICYYKWINKPGLYTRRRHKMDRNNIFPPLQWLKEYSGGWLKNDLFAGITLAAYGIPVSMAYATLAGLPVQCGIYGYFIGGIFYALSGTGRQLAIGPTSAISLIIGTSISTMAKGDVQHWVDIASLTALVLASFSFIAYLLKLSSVINFISESVLLGFKAGAAIVIAVTQLPKLFGIPGGGNGFLERIGIIISQLPETNFTVLLFGLTAIVILTACTRIIPGRPVAIILVIISILLMALTSLPGYGFALTGNIPAGLPAIHFPSIHKNMLQDVIPLAFACFLLAYIESVSAARTLASGGCYEIDIRQELLALAVANAAVAMGQSYPVTGGLSQSAVNSKAGAKTSLSLVFSSVVIALCLIFLTGPLKYLPGVMLAAILLVAVSGLIDLKGIMHLWRVSRVEFIVALIAFIGVVVLGLLLGVVIAAISSIVLLLREVSRPHVAFLGRIPGTMRYSDLNRHPDNETIPGLLILRVESSLFYFNAENVRRSIWNRLDTAEEKLRFVIWDLSTSPSIDISGARLIKKLYLDLKSRGIILKIAEAHAGVRDILRAEGLEDLSGHISRKISVNDLVIASRENPE
jgi:sulfate permease, SulP family